MNRLREVSGRGLEVCDHFDALVALSIPDILTMALYCACSPAAARGVTRYIEYSGQTFVDSIKAAMGAGSVSR